MNTQRALLITGLVLILITAHSAIARQPKAIYYQLTYQATGVSGQILINGFEIATFNGSPAAGGAPLNVWLLGKNNLQIRLKKSAPGSTASFTCGVSRRVQGEIVTSTDTGTLVSVSVDRDSLKSTDSLILNKSFNSSLDFSRTLQDAQPATITEVLNYAKHLFRLYQQKDTGAILQEQAIKLEDYSTAIGGMDLKDQMRRMLNEGLLRDTLNPLNSGDLRAVAVGPTKRIWQVFNGMNELISTQTTNGSSSSLPVYIGKLNGRLQVVR